jgi:hypothetical protein
MKPYAVVLVCLFLVLFLMIGCAQTTDTPTIESADPAGFWMGLWHGFILLFTFIVSLFNDGVGIYESHNSGHLYDLGFLLGVMVFFGGGGSGACQSGSACKKSE